EAGLAMVRARPVALYRIEGGGERRVAIRTEEGPVLVDPNRMFTEAGRRRELDAAGAAVDPEPLARFAEGVREAVGACVADAEHEAWITLHNNRDGGFSIASYLPGGSEAAAADPRPGNPVIRPRADPD